MRLELTRAEALHISYTVGVNHTWPLAEQEELPQVGGTGFVLKFLNVLRDYYEQPAEEATWLASPVVVHLIPSELWLIHSTFNVRELATEKLPDGSPVSALALKVWDAILRDRVLIGVEDARDEDDHAYLHARADGDTAVHQP